MKHTHLILPSLIALGVSISCAQEDLPTDGAGTGGTGTAATGGASATGGSAGSVAPGAGTGGSTGGTGGSTGGTGGSTGGTGGSTGGTGGSTGGGTTGGAAGSGATGGSLPMGGMSGTGGGSAGTTSVGGTAGMSAGGSGGDPAGGSAGTGSAGGPAAGSGGGGALDPAVITPGLDGFYWEGTCSGPETGHNCKIGSSCGPSSGEFYSQGVNITKSLKVMGTPGVKYTVTIEVRGVAGGRCYTGGTPGTMDGADLLANTNNGWYSGGKQLNDSIWNTYEIHVENPAVDGAANVYFANSVQPVANPDAFPSGTGNNCQMEMTIGYGYTASFPVMGDSTIRFLIHDSNCKGQQNCGRTAQSATCEPRTVSMTGVTPAATFAQPVTNTVGTDTFYPQWLYFDVKSITSP